MNYSRLNLLLAILILSSGSLYSGDQIGKAEYAKGKVVFAVYSDVNLQLPSDKPVRTGIAHIDRYLETIGVKKLERKFPHCLPPKPEGTDLRYIYNLYFAPTHDAEIVAKQIASFSEIRYAEPNYYYYPFMDYNDPGFEQQYAMELIQADRAHDISTGDTAVPLAIIDTGLDMDHSDLAGNLYINPGEDVNNDGRIDDNDRNNRDDDNNGKIDDFHGWDFDDGDNNPEDPGDGQAAGHGTHCAGIACAVTNNENGIASVGYDCSIIPIRAGGRRGQEEQDLADGFEYAVRAGARVISCSIGAPIESRVLEDVAEYAYENDVLIAAASGNLDPRMPFLQPEQVIYPAGYDHVLAVAATDSDDHKWGSENEGSNYGDWIDISAPGHGIYSCLLNNEYDLRSGTSMATPMVAGVAILIRANFPNMNVDETIDVILRGADDIDDINEQYRGKLGAGRINVYESLMMDGPGDDPRIFVNFQDTDFGDVEIGQSLDRTFSIMNSGGGDLTVSDISIDGEGFACNYGDEFTLQFRESREFTVTFSPEADGDFVGNMTITSNDPENGELNFQLTGSGILPRVPRIAVSANSLDFGEIVVGNRLMQELTISNTGQSALQVSDMTLRSEAFEIDFESLFYLNPGAERAFIIDFRPQEIMNYQDTLIITSNDPDFSQLHILLRGTGADPNSIEDEPDQYAADYQLLEVYPNPFNATLNMHVNLKQQSPVVLEVYDLSGKVVASPVNDILSAGMHEITWDAQPFANGMYIVRVQAGKDIARDKVLMMK